MHPWCMNNPYRVLLQWCSQFALKLDHFCYESTSKLLVYDHVKDVFLWTPKFKWHSHFIFALHLLCSSSQYLIWKFLQTVNLLQHSRASFFPFFFSEYHCLDKNLNILALAFPPFRLCVQSEEEKEAFSFLGMTAWMWRHLNLPRATREETVWHDCKWRKIGKAKQSILFILGWKAQQNNLRSHSLVFGRIMLFVSKKVVFKSTFFFEKIITKTWKKLSF